MKKAGLERGPVSGDLVGLVVDREEESGRGDDLGG